MKNYMLCLFWLLLSGSLWAQSNLDISFLRGLGNTCEWDDAAAQIDPPLAAFTTLDLFGPSTDPIESHDINYQGQLNAVVGHSMGGLVARSELIEGDRFEHLITIGTPHLGAPIAAQGSNAGTLIVWWIQDILAGPCAEWGGGWCFANNWIVNTLGLTLFPALVQALTPLGEPSTNQMIPGSAFMNNLNGSFEGSMPTPINNNRFIYGVEDWQHHYRLLSSTVNDCDPENGALANTVTILGFIYTVVSINHQFMAYYYLDLFFQTGDWWYLIQYIQEMYLALAWYQGAYSLLQLQQLEWSAYVDGSYLGPGNYWTSDGAVPTYSQAAVGLMPAQFTNFCLNTNHNEETKHPNAIAAVTAAIQQVGIF